MIIPTDKNIKTVTDLRENPIALLEQISKSGPAFIFQHSKPKAVMLSIEEYSNMIEVVEDHMKKNLNKAKQGSLELLKLAQKSRKELESLPADLRVRADEILYGK